MQREKASSWSDPSEGASNGGVNMDKETMRCRDYLQLRYDLGPCRYLEIYASASQGNFGDNKSVAGKE